MCIDNILPSYAFVPVEVMKEGKMKLKQQQVKSIGGYVDCVSVVDEYSGFAHCIGRVNKKCPELILKKAAEVFVMRWKCLKRIKTDKEFVSKKCQDVLHNIAVENNLQQIEIKIPPPGDHKRGLGISEGNGRWTQQTAQVIS